MNSLVSLTSRLSLIIQNILNISECRTGAYQCRASMDSFVFKLLTAINNIYLANALIAIPKPHFILKRVSTKVSWNMLLSVPICIIPLYYMCNIQLFVQSCLIPTILQRPTPVHEKICVQTPNVIFAERLSICRQLIYGICSGHLSERFQSVTGMDPYTPIMVAMGAVLCFVFPLHQLVHSHQLFTHVCVLKFPILSLLLKSVLFLYI